jgi:O-antigen/teichoic acid export membrane protein
VSRSTPEIVQRTSRSAAWLLGYGIANAAINFAVIAISALKFAPSDFGLLALASVSKALESGIVN